MPSSSLSTWRRQILSVPWQSWHRFSETPNTLGLPSQDSSWLVVDSHQYSTLCYLAPYLLELWKQALWKPLGSAFLHEPQKKTHTPSSWIHLVDLGLWWEFCRWDCSRWVYSPSICPPYISNSGNPPFFGSIQRLGFVEALWAPFESQQTSVDAPCPTKRGEGDGSRRGERCCVTACAQQVDVISVMSLGTEWQDGIVYSDDVLWSLVLFALSPSPDMCFQDPTVIVHWHFPSVVGHGMIDTSSPWHLDGASIIAVNSPTIQSRVSGCFWFPS